MSVDEIQYRYNQLYSKATEEVHLNILKKYIRLNIQLGNPEENRYTFFLHEIQRMEKELLVKKDEGNSDLVFMTISPPQTLPLQQFKKVIDKLFSKKWLVDYIYVYEQRSKEPDSVYGWHIHSLFYRNGKKYHEVVREVKNTIKGIIDLEVCYSALDIKMIKETDHNVKQLLNYILGDKNDNDKKEKQAIDKIAREKNNLLSYYILGTRIQQLLNAYEG